MKTTSAFLIFSVFAYTLFPVISGWADVNASGNKMVFSKSPINAQNPQELTSSFKSGDHIYILVTFPENASNSSANTHPLFPKGNNPLCARKFPFRG